MLNISASATKNIFPSGGTTSATKPPNSPPTITNSSSGITKTFASTDDSEIRLKYQITTGRLAICAESVIAAGNLNQSGSVSIFRRKSFARYISPAVDVKLSWKLTSKISSGECISIASAVNASIRAPTDSFCSAVPRNTSIPMHAERITCGSIPLKSVYVKITKKPSATVAQRGNFSHRHNHAVAAASKLICEPETDRMWIMPVVAKSSTSSAFSPA